ncbi:AAA family ATPase [Roseateles sp. NT4]|uniref:AAA family ATPase n=1 Tax=Roseateles sp. NT4 TaxID=3453715 RepID=UPI003EED3374
MAQNADVERWVLQGMPLHQHQDDCLFCASPLSEERLAALRTHFSKDLTTHADAIATCLRLSHTAVDGPVPPLPPHRHRRFGVPGACQARPDVRRLA